MDSRTIKDIRYYELQPENYQGKHDGILGNVYQSSPDTKYIGQRIARKLNELGFIAGEFDHIYINLSSYLKDGEIIENDKFLDKQIRHFDFGIKPNDFNNLTDYEKDVMIKNVTFQVLQLISKNDDLKSEWRIRAKWSTNSAVNWSSHSAANWSTYSAAKWST